MAVTKPLRLLGRQVGPIGYGMMGLTWRARPEDCPPQTQAFGALQAASKHGSTFWDGGEIYGTPEYNSLHLLKDFFTKHPDEAEDVIISIKGGAKRGSLQTDGSPENTRRSIEECLRVLDGRKKLDIWSSARVDTEIPIEITMEEANKYVKSGKVGGIGLSEPSARSIRRAAKVTNVAAVEVEFSLWETTIFDNDVASTCAELNIPIVAYSPLGRGFLTGQFKKPEDIPDEDFRKPIPRFQGENFYRNLDIVHQVEEMAEKKSCTSGQVALAWIKGVSARPDMPAIIPIPGASAAERVEENCKEVSLNKEEMDKIDEILKSFKTTGDRYPKEAIWKLFADSPEL